MPRRPAETPVPRAPAFSRAAAFGRARCRVLARA